MKEGSFCDGLACSFSPLFCSLRRSSIQQQSTTMTSYANQGPKPEGEAAHNTRGERGERRDDSNDAGRVNSDNWQREPA